MRTFIGEAPEKCPYCDKDSNWLIARNPKTYVAYHALYELHSTTEIRQCMECEEEIRVVMTDQILN